MAMSLNLEETALVERRLLLLVALVETLAEKMMMMMSYYESPYPLQPNYKYLSGLAILPSIAEAAAVAGDER
jgi:hypothetical protein